MSGLHVQDSSRNCENMLLSFLPEKPNGRQEERLAHQVYLESKQTTWTWIIWQLQLDVEECPRLLILYE